MERYVNYKTSKTKVVAISLKLDDPYWIRRISSQVDAETSIKETTYSGGWI